MFLNRCDEIPNPSDFYLEMFQTRSLKDLRSVAHIKRLIECLTQGGSSDNVLRMFEKSRFVGS